MRARPSPPTSPCSGSPRAPTPEPARVGDSGTLELRLAPGTYSLATFLDVRGSHGADSLGLGFLAAPEVTLDRDREVTLDGRGLREIRADVDRRTETRQLVMEYARKADGADLFGAVQVPPHPRQRLRRAHPRRSPGAASSTGPCGGWPHRC